MISRTSGKFNYLLMANAYFYGICAIALFASEIATLDLLYEETGSLRWAGGLIGLIVPPVIAARSYLTSERDTWFSGRMLAGWVLGIAVALLCAAVRSYFH